MSWRTVVISSRSKLDLQLNCMVIRSEITTKIHMSEISVLIIENTAVSLTAALLSELTRNKIKIIFCDGQHNPQSEIVPYYGCHDCSAKLRMQLSWSENIQGEIWTLIVKEKIRQQSLLLKTYQFPQVELLKEYLKQVNYRDTTNREGFAAKVYFNALFGMDFTRSEDTPINAALNYGYTILLSAMNREIAANGYLTQLGLSHENMFNFFNLGSDLMEPFRPLVDEIVYEMQLAQFEKKERLEIISLLNKTVFINSTKQYVNNAIKIYCKSVFDALNEADTSLLRFYYKK